MFIFKDCVFWTYHRMSIIPENLEFQVLFHFNRNHWFVKDFGKVLLEIASISNKVSKK